MCGLVAMIGVSGRQPDAQAIGSMANSISHRGPDEGGSFLDGVVGFGFRRLSILDLSLHGHQPMISEDGNTIIVFNGEIYNYIEIRKELVSLGHGFRSTGDTEVLLNAYRQWGEDCLRRLNGMWAFLIYDRIEGKIFGSRDRFGVKPLYLLRTQDWVMFASEIKAFSASGEYKPSPNWNLAAQYLIEGRLSEPDENNATLYSDVFEVAAGSAFRMDLNGNIKKWKYWEIGIGAGTISGDPFEQFAALFEDSVRLRMRSDVPVGVCLSGGLDSTSIICHMERLLKSGKASGGADSELQAFSYMAPEFDESSQIMATVNQTGAMLNRLTLNSNDFWDRLVDVMKFQDEPVHSMNVVVSYELYRMSAKNGVKVILNGQGADECLAGYPSYFKQYWYSLLGSGKFRNCWNEISEYSKSHETNAKKLFADALRYVIQTQFAHLQLYRRLAYWKRKKRVNSDSWFDSDLVGQSDAEVPVFVDQDLDTSLRNSMRKEPLPLYLRVEDRNSMAHSVETRLPFLDYRLVNYAFSLANDMKLRGPLNKYILRESMKERIPEVVRNRVDKLGFPVPQAKWFAGPLHDNLQDLVSSQAVRERGIYQSAQILRDVAAMRGKDSGLSHKVFRIVQFEMFCNLLQNARIA